MTTTYGPLFNPYLVVIGTIGLIFFAILQGLRYGERDSRYWIISGISILGFLIVWEVLTILFRFLTYFGGTIELISMYQTITDLSAYLCTLGLQHGAGLFRDQERSLEKLRLELSRKKDQA